MLRSTKEMQGYHLQATDGEIGKVQDFYFDDQHWTIRYVVADTGGWLSGRSVLLSPLAFRETDADGQLLRASLTKEQIENAPGIGEDEPVSRQYETAYYDHYRWPHYWSGPYLWGQGAFPSAAPAAPLPVDGPDRDEPDGDPHLRSIREVTGYHIAAADGEIGHVEDLLIDDKSWQILHLVIDTANWLPGKKVLISPESISHISWSEGTVTLHLTRGQVEAQDEFDPSSMLDTSRHNFA